MKPKVFNDALRGPYIKVCRHDIPDEIWYDDHKLARHLREMVAFAELEYEAKRQRRRERLSGRVWQAILDRFEHRCAYCGAEGKMQQDHRMPVALGGRTTVDNIVPACFECNNRKRANHPDNWPLRPGVA